MSDVRQAELLVHLSECETQINQVRSELLCVGFAAVDVEERPDWCIRQLVATQRETDWRDAFMAAIAGGETPIGAAGFADAAVDLLHAQRQKTKGKTS